mgnify:FL=1
MKKKPVYTEHLKLGVPLSKTKKREKLRAIAVIGIDSDLHRRTPVVNHLTEISHID